MRTRVLISMILAFQLIGFSCFARVTDQQKAWCAREKLEHRLVAHLPPEFRVVPSSLRVHGSYEPDALLMIPGNIVSTMTGGKFPRIETDYVEFTAVRGPDVIHGWISATTRPSVSSAHDPSDCRVIDSEAHKFAQIRLRTWGLYADSTEIQNSLRTQTQATALTAWTYAQRARQAQIKEEEDDEARRSSQP